MRNFFVMLTLIAAMWSCSESKDANYQALISTEWELREVIAPDSLSVELPPDKVYIVFTDSSTMSGFAGCNNFFGTFSTYEQDQIIVNPVGRTMSFCPYMSFEDRMMSILPMCTSYTASTDELELNDTANGVTLLFKAKLIE